MYPILLSDTLEKVKDFHKMVFEKVCIVCFDVDFFPFQ